MDFFFAFVIVVGRELQYPTPKGITLEVLGKQHVSEDLEFRALA